MPRWAFLSNYGFVLSYIALHSNSTAREIADAVGITERATRKIIADLSAEGYIIKSKQGRRNSYGIDPDLVLQHPAHDETPVGELLKVLGWRRKIKRQRAGAPDSQLTAVP